MPTVPMYGGSKTTLGGLPEARLSGQATDEAFGGGDGFRNLQKVSLAIYEEEKAKADMVAVLDADRLLSEYENTALYDPKTGALNSKGKDAFGAPDKVRDGFQKVYDQAYSGLTSDAQRVAFRRFADSRRRDINRSVMSHVSRESRAYDDTVTTSAIINERNAAVNASASGDFDRVAISIQRQIGMISSKAQRDGIGDTGWVKQKTGEIVGATHAAVIERMLANTQDQKAKEYFDMVGDQMPEDIKTGIAQKLEKSYNTNEGIRRADGVWNEMGPKKDIDPVELDKMEKKLRADLADKPEVMKSAISDLRSRTEAFNKSQSERAVANLDKVWKLIDEGTPLTRVRQSPEWESLPRGQAVAIINAVEDRRYALGQRGRGGEGVDDTDSWLKFLDLNAVNLAKMSSGELKTQFYGKLSPSNWQRAALQWNAAREAAAKGGVKTPELSATINFKDVVENSLRLSGVIPVDKKISDMNQSQKRAYVALESQAASEVENWELTKNAGNKATRQQQQQIVNDIIVRNKVMVDEWGRDPQLPAFAVDPKDYSKVYVPLKDISMPARVKIYNMMLSNGVIPAGLSQAEAERRYQRRFERAYGMDRVGNDPAEILLMMKGQK